MPGPYALTTVNPQPELEVVTSGGEVVTEPADLSTFTTAAQVAAAIAAAVGLLATQYAQFVQRTQGSNLSVAPGTAVSYLVDHPTGVVDTIGIVTNTGPGGVGTAFQLPPGDYWVDFENSADAAWSLAIYQGGTNTVLTVNNDTIAGASTATTWIHGRAFVRATLGNPWVMVSPVTGTQAIPTAGTAAGMYIARVSFTKVA